MKRSFLLAAVIGAGLACTAAASQFRTVSPMAMSMGGAGVGWPQGAFASYYNPAALAIGKGTEVSASGGIATRDTGLSGSLDRLLDLDVDWDEATADPTGPDAAQVLHELSYIKSSDGILLAPGGAFAARYDAIGVGIYPGMEVAFFSSLDTVHVNKTDPTVDPNSFFFNRSELYAKGLGLGEVSFAYGTGFPLRNVGRLCVGGAVKYIHGLTYDGVGKMTIGPNSLGDRLLENTDKSASAFGLDIGLMLTALQSGWSAGLLARNINSPKFDTVRDRSITEDMQVRAGGAYSFTKSVYGAVDIDVTDNETLVTGVHARQIGGGLCWQALDWMSLRVGAQKTLSEVPTQVLVTMGASVGWKKFNVELAGAIPTEWSEINDITLPAEGEVILGVNAAW